MTTPTYDSSDFDDKVHLSIKGTAKLVVNISTFVENTVKPDGTERKEKLRMAGGGLVMNQNRMHRRVYQQCVLSDQSWAHFPECAKT